MLAELFYAIQERILVVGDLINGSCPIFYNRKWDFGYPTPISLSLIFFGGTKFTHFHFFLSFIRTPLNFSGRRAEPYFDCDLPRPKSIINYFFLREVQLFFVLVEKILFQKIWQ